MFGSNKDSTKSVIAMMARTVLVDGLFPCVLMTLLGSNVSKASQLLPPNLVIIWEKTYGRLDSEAAKSPDYRELWAKVCKQLSSSLQTGSGPFGMGIFKASTCYIDRELTSGVATKHAWKLTIREGKVATTLELRAGLKNSSALMSRFEIPGSEWSLTFFQDQEFVDLVSLRLLNDLPVMGWVEKGGLYRGRSKDDGRFSGRAFTASTTNKDFHAEISPPDQIISYTGTIAGTYIVPTTIGQGVRASTSTGTVTWTFDEVTRVFSRQNGFWIHDARGRGALLAKIDSAIETASAALEDACRSGLFSQFLKGITDTTASGYIGLRYGKQMLSGDPLLKKTAFYGLLAEVRGGPLKGLRYYYDTVPLTTNTENGLETSIKWSRHIIGTSFGLDLSRFVDRVDLTPKIGLWSFNAALVDSRYLDGTAASVGSFDFNRGLSFSLEVGAEWLSSWYTIRTWYSYDYANALNSVSKQKVTSNRLGLDTFWTAGPVFRPFGIPLRTALLGFGEFEAITLSAANTTPTVDAGQHTIVGVTLIDVYLGCGLAVSW